MQRPKKNSAHPVAIEKGKKLANVFPSNFIELAP